jgi:hypothetical protein
MVILKATLFLEGHKRDMGMTCSITPEDGMYVFPSHRNCTNQNKMIAVQKARCGNAISVLSIVDPVAPLTKMNRDRKKKSREEINN